MADDTLSDRFPQLPDGVTRKLYFDAIDAKWLSILESRGYRPIMIMTMPIDTADGRKEQLTGVLQGLADGTITGESQRLKGVELALKTLGMLTDTHRDVKSATRQPESTIEMINALKNTSGNTLHGSGKVVDQKALLEQYSNAPKETKAKGKLRATRKVGGE